MAAFIEGLVITYIKGGIMVTLRQVLDQTLELLQYEGRFKSFGDLSKHKYQMSKPDEDKEIRRIMYEGGLGNSEEAKKKSSATRKKRHKEGKYKESEKKAAENRANWYKNPENYEKFKKKIRERDEKKKAAQSSGSKA